VRYFVIVNPTSGRGSAAKLGSFIKQTLTNIGLDYELAVTQYPWHAAELSELAARRGFDVVVSAGGDGTANEVVNGLMFAQSQGMRHTSLGLLPVGSGNDLAAALELPMDLYAAAQVLKSGGRRWMDIGFARSDNYPEGRFFCNCVGVGFDAAGSILARRITYVGGMLAYLIASIQTIFTYHASAPTLKIDLDGVLSIQKSLMVSVMNGRRIGGGFLTAPNSRLDDGQFDLCIAQSVSQVRMFSLIPHFIKGTQSSQPEISMAHARNIKINALEGTMPIQMDGEIFCEQGIRLEVEILPNQIQVMGVPL